MKIRLYALIVFLLFSATGCYATITGTVVDSETGEPIEGAVVLVEWTKTKGVPGMTHTESYKVIEAVTDKEGKATVSGVFNPMVNPPDITIYKMGYVAWNNKFIFPNYEKRKDFKWQSVYVFRMERFKDNYSFIDHQSFLDGTAHLFVETEKKKLFIKAYDEWERAQVIKERRNRDSSKGGNGK
jgi:hypothetical protein